MGPFGYECGDRVVFEVLAVVEVDLEDVAAMQSKSYYAFVTELGAPVEFEPFEMLAALRHCLKRLVCDLFTIRDVQPLQPDCVVRQSVHGLVANRFHTCNVQS